jgi:hypothetical protein
LIGSLAILSTLGLAQNAFVDLGTLNATAISRDGFTVVGTIQVNGNTHAAYWYAGVVTDLNIDAASSAAKGCSADGSVIVGSYTPESGHQTPFRWTKTGGLQTLPLPPTTMDASASLISGDGKTIVLQYLDNTKQFNWVSLWTAAKGTVPVTSSDTSDGITVFAINKDGTVIGGERELVGQNNGNVWSTYFKYAPAFTPGASPTALGTTPWCMVKGAEVSLAPTSKLITAVLSVSDDGTKLYGGAYDASVAAVTDSKDRPFFYYTSSLNGVFPVQWVLSGSGTFVQDFGFETLSTSGDGSVAVGDEPAFIWTNAHVYDETDGTSIAYTYYSYFNPQPVYWSAALGVTILETFLDDCGLTSATEDWTLSTDFGISSSGTNLIGSGTNNGQAQSWLAYELGAPSSLKLGSSSVVGNQSTTATLALNGLSGPDGETVTLSSSNAAASVPNSIAVAPWSTTASFAISTQPVAENTSVTITAAIGSSSTTATLTVSAPVITVLSLTPPALIGGTSSAGALELTSNAFAPGYNVALSSNNANVVVPATIPVATGTAIGSFPITTKAVSTSVTATITATLHGVSKTATLTVEAAALSVLRLTSATLVGGNGMNVAVYLNGAAGPGGTSVSVSSNTPSVAVPATVLVPSGQTAIAFPITTSGVSANTVATITATRGPIKLTKTLTLTPAGLTGISATPAALIGGAGSQVNLSLNGQAGPSGSVVAMSSNNSNVVVPTSAGVLGGHSSVSVPVTTKPVSTTVVATVTATFLGVSKTTTITDEAAALSVLRLTSATLKSGSGMNVAVYLNGPAGPGGATVTISSSNTDVKVPSSVVVPAGQTALAFPVTSSKVSANTSVTLTAIKGPVTLKQTLTLTP